jgi:hypothetical protein
MGIRQRFVESLLSGDRSTSFGKACLLLKQAIESPFPDQQLELGRQAVALGPDLGELYGEPVQSVHARRDVVAEYGKGTVSPQQVFGTRAPTVADGLRALVNWATRLLVESLSGAVVTAGSDGVPGLVAFATYDEPGGAGAVVLIRHKPGGLTYDFDVALPPGTWGGAAHTLSAPALSSPASEISSNHPSVGPASGSGSVVVPAQSLIVLKLHRV